MLKGVYQPRNPKASGFSQCLAQHVDEFEASYEQTYQERYGFSRPVIRKVVKKFFLCGDLSQGFARVQCGQCQSEYLLPFSCKGRYFCRPAIRSGSCSLAHGSPRTCCLRFPLASMCSRSPRCSASISERIAASWAHSANAPMPV